MKKISAETMVRTIVLAFALLNQVLTMFGVNPLPFSEEEVYQGCTALLTVVFSLAVNLTAQKKLRDLDMVEALKSIE